KPRRKVPRRRDRAMRSRVIQPRRPARAKASTVDLSHDDVDAGVDRNHVGEQVTFHHFRNGGTADERRRTTSPAHRLGGPVRYHIVALLSLGTFHREIRLTDWWTRSLHHDFEMVD